MAGRTFRVSARGLHGPLPRRLPPKNRSIKETGIGTFDPTDVEGMRKATKRMLRETAAMAKAKAGAGAAPAPATAAVPTRQARLNATIKKVNKKRASRKPLQLFGVGFRHKRR